MTAQPLAPSIGWQLRFASASSAVVDVQAGPSRDMASTRYSTVEAPSDLPNLDLLRTVAVLLVFVGHLMLTAGVRGLGDVGRFGVLIFFVHTSLVLMLSMERLGLTGGRLYFAFLIRRFFRIYPRYFQRWLFTFRRRLGYPGTSKLGGRKICQTFSSSKILPIAVQFLPFFGPCRLKSRCMQSCLCSLSPCGVLSRYAWPS